MILGGLNLHAERPDPDEAMVRLFLEWIMPMWTVAGALDWSFHVGTDIEHTAGLPENLLHDLMFTQIGLPIVIGLVCEMNPTTIAVMTAVMLSHQASAYYDASFALTRRHLSIWEQHVHSFFEVLPFATIMAAVGLHQQTLRRQKFGALKLRERQMPLSGFIATAAMVAIPLVLYGNECYRCVRALREPKRHPLPPTPNLLRPW